LDRYELDVYDAIGAAGAFSFVCGTFLVYRPAGYMVAGALAMALGVVGARNTKRRKAPRRQH
jgi:hypothetical protein